MTNNPDPYNVLDPILEPWEKKHSIRMFKLYRDDPVRSFWVYDRLGNQRAQLWLGLPDGEGHLTVFAAEFVPANPSRWGRREQRMTTIPNLAAVLDELRTIIFEWAGPGAFA